MRGCTGPSAVDIFVEIAPVILYYILSSGKCWTQRLRHMIQYTVLHVSGESGVGEPCTMGETQTYVCMLLKYRKHSRCSVFTPPPRPVNIIPGPATRDYEGSMGI